MDCVSCRLSLYELHFFFVFDFRFWVFFFVFEIEITTLDLAVVA